MNHKNPQLNLGVDYLDGAEGFLLAARKIIASADKESSEWLFRLENPVSFLICHAAELILKAGLVRSDSFEAVKFTHDLMLLIRVSQEKRVPLRADFCSCVDVISENFLKHDHRYHRNFAGLPEGEDERLRIMVRENPQQAVAEYRKHGLFVRRAPNFDLFLQASSGQLGDITEWLSKQSM